MKPKSIDITAKYLDRLAFECAVVEPGAMVVSFHARLEPVSAATAETALRELSGDTSPQDVAIDPR